MQGGGRGIALVYVLLHTFLLGTVCILVVYYWVNIKYSADPRDVFGIPKRFPCARVVRVESSKSTLVKRYYFTGEDYDVGIRPLKATFIIYSRVFNNLQKKTSRGVPRLLYTRVSSVFSVFCHPQRDRKLSDDRHCQQVVSEKWRFYEKVDTVAWRSRAVVSLPSPAQRSHQS